MPLFGALYTGRSGLQTGQEALNVVAHNITNADTAGYVRQQVSQGTREYTLLSLNTSGVAKRQAGLGVYISEVRQVRDQFLDASYRREVGRSGFYGISYSAVEEVEGIFGELDGATFNESMNNLWKSIEELVKDPSSEVCQNMLVQYSQSFAEAAKNVYQDLSDYQDELNSTVTSMVDRINEIGHSIYKLNEKIRGIEVGGIENANDLKDERNALLDELGELCNISYTSDVFGNVLVKIEGHDFINTARVNEMAYQADEGTGFYTCFWPDIAKSRIDENGELQYDAKTAQVFNLNSPISAVNNTDVGKLKGVLLARGDHRANYTDLATEESYNKVSNSVMMNVMAEFDGLVHNLVTAVNKVLADNADPATNYLVDENGNPIQLFQRIGIDGEYEIDPVTGDYIHSPEIPENRSTLFTCSNLKVNEDLLQYPTHLSFMKADGSVDYKTAKDLEAAFDSKEYILNPTLTNRISIREFYSSLMAQVSNSGNVYKNLSDNQGLTVESIEASRQGMIGVSTDEELSNMIRFQNAYNASSRFINVIDECIEHVISQLGTG
ncbi:MAG: flagellar hook-associated protein FlgK [Lachnospiraceae bacterium]